MADRIIPTTADDPEAARAEIERTRARMSETLDEIEDVLLIKKRQIQDRLDIVARIRERPMQAAGAALAAGLVLGLLTGGGRRKRGSDVQQGTERADMWEARARRLLDIARRQEEEIDELEAALADVTEPEYGEVYDVELEEEAPSRLAELREVVAGRLAEIAGDTAERLVEAVRRH